VRRSAMLDYLRRSAMLDSTYHREEEIYKYIG
jgi:hypothetical protein